jgi:hypothetical protein
MDTAKIAPARNEKHQPEGFIRQARRGKAPQGMIAEAQDIEDLPRTVIAQQTPHLLEGIYIKYRVCQSTTFLSAARVVRLGT